MMTAGTTVERLFLEPLTLYVLVFAMDDIITCLSVCLSVMVLVLVIVILRSESWRIVRTL